VTEKSPNYEVDELPPLEKENIDPLPWEHGPGTKLVLEAMGLTGDEQAMLVSCRVVEFTVEAKVNDGNYGSSRGYVRLEPEDLRIHVPVYNPRQLVDDAGNVDVFGQVYRYISRELDLAVFDTASRRVDQAVAAKDAEAAVQSQRFDAGKGVIIAQKKTGVTL